MITVNVEKAKVVAHAIRRALREEEFKPLDDIIAKQIPGRAEGAEAQRVAIREKYKDIQDQIDAATTFEEIKAILPPQ